jgi:hypothetical protein
MSTETFVAGPGSNGRRALPESTELGRLRPILGMYVAIASCHALVTKGRPRRWLVVLVREEDEIHAKLRRVLAADRDARVIFDWRATAARNPPWVTRSLRIHGFAVIPAVGKGRQNSHRAAAAG